MKIKIFTFTLAFFSFVAAYAQPGAQNIRFTGKANAVNGLDIYAENMSGTDISGLLGGGNLTLCVLVPSSISPKPTVTVSSTIPQETFFANIFTPAEITISSVAYDVYSVNGNGSPTVDFPPGVEVLIATYTFTGIPVQTSTLLLGALPAAGSGFDNYYIAPGGVDETDYANPFYSDIPSDPGLHNSGGVNDAGTSTLSYLAVANVTLPIKFTGFAATKKDNSALLNWSIVNENSTSKGYEVERSFDGVTFEDVASVAVKTGVSSNTYSYTDDNLSSLNSPGIIYYRIKQTAIDGSISYTDIRAVSLSYSVVIRAYPNPAKDNISVLVNLSEASDVSIDLSDASGKQLKLLQLAGAKGSNLSSISLAGYASGKYLVKVTSASGTTTIPVVKE